MPVLHLPPSSPLIKGHLHIVQISRMILAELSRAESKKGEKNSKKKIKKNKYFYLWKIHSEEVWTRRPSSYLVTRHRYFCVAAFRQKCITPNSKRTKFAASRSPSNHRPSSPPPRRTVRRTATTVMECYGYGGCWIYNIRSHRRICAYRKALKPSDLIRRSASTQKKKTNREIFNFKQKKVFVIK